MAHLLLSPGALDRRGQDVDHRLEKDGLLLAALSAGGQRHTEHPPGLSPSRNLEREPVVRRGTCPGRPAGDGAGQQLVAAALEQRDPGIAERARYRADQLVHQRLVIASDQGTLSDRRHRRLLGGAPAQLSRCPGMLDGDPRQVGGHVGQPEIRARWAPVARRSTWRSCPPPAPYSHAAESTSRRADRTGAPPPGRSPTTGRWRCR